MHEWTRQDQGLTSINFIWFLYLWFFSLTKCAIFTYNVKPDMTCFYGCWVHANDSKLMEDNNNKLLF